MSPPDKLQNCLRFAQRYGMSKPILLAPMAGACPPALSIAVAESGGMGACGALLMEPDAIDQWVKTFRNKTDGPVQLNTWIPDPEPERNTHHEAQLRSFLSQWGPESPLTDLNATLPVFEDQCARMIEARPTAMSSIMGLFPDSVVRMMKQAGIAWFATVTTVSEAKMAQEAGADAVVAQGMEAGGHRGSFDAAQAEHSLAGLFSLLPAVVDAIDLPVIATGGIADSRGIAAALMLGASAVQIGSGYLRTPEAGISPVWADAMQHALPDDTVTTRAFSGRLGRSLKTPYTVAAASAQAPSPAPYPTQRNLTKAMREHANSEGRLDAMQAWAGQSSALAARVSAAQLTDKLWLDALDRLSQYNPV